MSYKETIVKQSDCNYIMAGSKLAPVAIFMSERLMHDSEERLWQEVATIAAFPGVQRVAVTPDAHASGNGIPVGVAVETSDTIICCAAGYDISCGIAAVKTNLTLDDVRDNTKVRAWIDAVEMRVATGAGRHRSDKQRRYTPSQFKNILERGALAIEYNKRVLDNLERTHLPVDMEQLLDIEDAKRGEGQLGSLGGGNHFLELDIDQDGNVWVQIHTGSRGYGHGTATHFFNAGAELLGLPKREREKTYFRVDSLHGKQYINHMNAAANYAIVNRLAIFRAVEEATEEVFGGESQLYYEISHNLVQVEEGKYMHRKGATRAFPSGHPALKGRWKDTGHPILIPGSMGTSSAILFAEQGASRSLYSINHGCGRVMGRGAAKRDLGSLQQEIDNEMLKMGILINTRNVPLDECLHVYKGIDEVLNAVSGAGLATVTHVLRPRAVIKGAD